MTGKNPNKIFRTTLILVSIIFSLNCGNISKKEDEPQKLFRQLFLLGIITFNQSSAFEQYALSTIDLSRYAGEWYEIERIPNSFQGNLTNVKAIYTPRPDGNVTVTNEGTNPDGSLSRIDGIGIPSNLPKAILKVSFFYPFVFSDYYVVGLDTANYSHAMVGSPTPNILWILSRTPTLDNSILDTYKQNARSMGYSVDLLRSYKN